MIGSFVRPSGARCTTEWKPAVVTDVTATNIEVDGVPRHVSDLRKAPDRGGEENVSSLCRNEAVEENYRARLRPRTVDPSCYRV